MKKKIISMVDPSDNVATALKDISGGKEVEIPLQEENVNSVQSRESIEFGHKIAIRNIPEGEPIYKYGVNVGKATENISAGEWVHVHNVESNYGRGDT
jgi:altronate dehydratase small subunit